MPASISFPAIRQLYGETWYVRLAVQGVLIAFVSFVGFPFLFKGLFPMTHEAERYVVLSAHFRQAIDAGIGYPRWLPDLAGGMGYPTFCFYQPLFFYFSSFITKLFQTTDAQGVFFAILASLWLGMNGFYIAARHWGSIGWSLFATFFFSLTPYLYINLFVRGDLSEFMSIMVLPWSLAFLFRMVACGKEQRSIWPSCIGLAISLAGVVPAHPTTGLGWFAVFPFLTLAAIWQSPRAMRFTLFCGMIASGSFALALSMPYWEPVFRLKPYVMLDQAITGYYISARHVVGLHQFFLRGWGFGGSVPDSFQDTMSLQLGLPHFLFAVTGLYFGRKQPLMVATGILYFGLIVAMSSLTFIVWALVSPLSWFQFPWRLFAVVAPLQALLIVAIDETQFRQRKYLLMIFAAAVGTLWFYWPQFSLNPEVRSTSEEVQNVCDELLAKSFTTYQVYAGQNEFLPKTAVNGIGFYLTDRPILSAKDPQSVKPLPDHTRHRIHYSIDVDAPQSVVIQQYYFPGWHVEVNGEVFADEDLVNHLTEHGLMTVPIAPGRSELIAYYAGPPGGGLRSGVMLLTSLLFVTIQIALHRRLKALPPLPHA